MLCLAAIAVSHPYLRANLHWSDQVQVKRGLTQWASGTFNKGGSFERIPWGMEAMHDFFPTAGKLTESKWDKIFGKAEAIIEATCGKILLGNGDEEDEDEQPATTLFMSP